MMSDNIACGSMKWLSLMLYYILETYLMFCDSI